MKSKKESLRNQVFQYVSDNYGAQIVAKWPDRYPNYAVLCHPVTGKWFGNVMDIPGSYIGLDSDEIIDVINVKADPLLITSLVKEEGYHRAWHMNKTHWITIRLDGSVPFEKVAALIDMSYTLVAPKRRSR